MSELGSIKNEMWKLAVADLVKELHPTHKNPLDQVVSLFFSLQQCQRRPPLQCSASSEYVPLVQDDKQAAWHDGTQLLLLHAHEQRAKNMCIAAVPKRFVNMTTGRWKVFGSVPKKVNWPWHHHFGTRYSGLTCQDKQKQNSPLPHETSIMARLTYLTSLYKQQLFFNMLCSWMVTLRHKKYAKTSYVQYTFCWPGMLLECVSMFI